MPAKRKSKRRRKKSARPRPKAHVNDKHKMSMEEERTLFMKEQTILAKERTILSFMRTGLGFITAGFAMVAGVAILDEFFNINPMTSIVIGSGLVVVGFLEIIESFRRLTLYRKKMKEISKELGDECV